MVSQWLPGLQRAGPSAPLDEVYSVHRVPRKRCDETVSAIANIEKWGHSKRSGCRGDYLTTTSVRARVGIVDCAGAIAAPVSLAKFSAMPLYSDG